ncbi:unnamed protein product [Sphagnum jensenii]|uniref:Mechanosensitive ion channel MscS domain-containing protein n=1 Tax=Sphagnum jensenii TaxID=128206 RepID=A0ABP1AC39_9BRYO
MAVLQRVARNCNCHKLSNYGGFFDMQTNTGMHKPKIPAFSPQCQHKYGTMVACWPVENLEARHGVIAGEMEKSKLSGARNVGFHPSNKYRISASSSSSSSLRTLLRAMTGGSSSTWNPAAPTASDHVLNCVTCLLLKKWGELFGPIGSILEAEFDFLDWLPEKLHAHLHNSEGIAILMVRESLVLGILGFLYAQVDHFCRWLHRLYTTTSKADSLDYEDEFQQSVFHLAIAPVHLLILVWASTRLVRVAAPFFQMQQLVGMGMVAKARKLGLVTTVTWFFLRWKDVYIQKLISHHITDKPRILVVSKLVSLTIYFLAATILADLLNFPLGSLLAFGGVSGIAMGLAAKEVVSNFFGGAVLLITRPFVIGDRIKAGSFAGLVQDIGFLQTKILGFDGVPILVPNQAFINQVINNMSRATSKSLEAEFLLQNQNIFMVEKITERVTQYLYMNSHVDSKRTRPLCYLKDISQAGPKIAIMCNINLLAGGNYNLIKQEILLETARIIVEILGKDAPFLRNNVTNLLRELRMLLLNADGEGI